MDFNLVIDLFLDTTGPLKPARFLNSRASTNQLQGSALTLISSDTPKIRLFLLKPADAVGIPADCLGHDGTIFLTLKAAPGNSTLLAVATGFTFVVDPVLGDHFEAVLDLNTVAIATEMESVERIDGLFDIELQSPANAARLTFQSGFSLFKQVQTGDEEDPTPASAISSFIANAQDTINDLVEEAEAAISAVQDGKSAYEIAVDNGFVGTEEEWLISIRGANGTISGSNGVVLLTASRDFAQSDDGKWLYSTSGAGITLTMPASGITPGFGCTVVQMGTGQITFAAAGGVTLGNSFSYTKTRGQYSPASIGMLTATLGFTSGEMA